MEDTMTPEKPEDFETAIQQMPKFLKKELEEMIGDKPIDISIDNNNMMMPWLEKNRQLQKENIPNIVKCTCPIQFYTKKRNKKKNLIVMRKQDNGYYVHCPVHTKL